MASPANGPNDALSVEDLESMPIDLLLSAQAPSIELLIADVRLAEILEQIWEQEQQPQPKQKRGGLTVHYLSTGQIGEIGQQRHDECNVCSGYIEEQDWIGTKCLHKFHKSCFEGSVQFFPHCPNCRFGFSKPKPL